MKPMSGALLAALLLPVVAARAHTCDATFSKKGNPITGLKYTALASVADVAVADAINQLRGIALGRDYDVLASEPAAGDLLME
jgi:hypothetical protein